MKATHLIRDSTAAQHAHCTFSLTSAIVMVKFSCTRVSFSSSFFAMIFLGPSSVRASLHL